MIDALFLPMRKKTYGICPYNVSCLVMKMLQYYDFDAVNGDSVRGCSSRPWRPLIETICSWTQTRIRVLNAPPLPEMER